MAIIEFQIRKQMFLDFFRAEINQRRLPFPTIPAPLLIVTPSLSGSSLQRIECVGCTMEPSAGEGYVTIEAQMVFHHNTLSEAKAAGSLQAPVTQQLPVTVSIRLAVFLPAPSQKLPPSLQWSSSLGLFPGGVVALALPDKAVVLAGAVEASADVVAVRLATSLDDSINDPVRDRLGGSHWSIMVAGQLFADTLTASLNDVLDGKLGDELKPDKAASGAWYPYNHQTGERFEGATATATVTAVDACPLFDIDIPIDLMLNLNIQPSGDSLVQTIALSWDPDSTWCQIAALPFAPAIRALVRNGVTEELWGMSAAPNGFKQTGGDDSSIIYQQTTFLVTPSPRFTLTHSAVGEEGLRTAGTLSIQNGPRGLEGEVSSPHSGLDVDCHRRQVSVKFYPGGVSLRDIGIQGGAPRLFPGRVWFIPAGAWMVKPGVSNTWLDLALTFTDPPTGRLPAGTATSVFLHTDCGLRWVDLGVIPADRPPPTSADVIQMISQCMAISDPWGMGVLHLNWLVDPPDIFFGIDPVRQWSLGIRELPEAVRLEFVARGPGGAERPLGVIEGHRNVVIELATDADETLEVRTGGPLNAPAPVVYQRWMVPFATLPLGNGRVTFASAGGAIGLRDRSGKTRLVDAGVDGEVRTRIAEGRMHAEGTRDCAFLFHGHRRRLAFRRIEDALNREGRRNLDVWAVAARVDKNTVAIAHRGNLLIGSARPRVGL